jgi:hypothetical protein
METEAVVSIDVDEPDCATPTRKVPRFSEVKLEQPLPKTWQIEDHGMLTVNSAPAVGVPLEETPVVITVAVEELEGVKSTITVVLGTVVKTNVTDSTVLS